MLIMGHCKPCSPSMSMTSSPFCLRMNHVEASSLTDTTKKPSTKQPSPNSHNRPGPIEVCSMEHHLSCHNDKRAWRTSQVIGTRLRTTSHGMGPRGGPSPQPRPHKRALNEVHGAAASGRRLVLAHRAVVLICHAVLSPALTPCCSPGARAPAGPPGTWGRYGPAGARGTMAGTQSSSSASAHSLDSPQLAAERGGPGGPLSGPKWGQYGSGGGGGPGPAQSTRRTASG